MTMTQTNTRNANMADLIDLLIEQSADKHDAIVPMQAITSVGGVLKIAGMGLDGPTGTPGEFVPTVIMDGHLADKLGVPVKYVRWMRENRIDLYDANVNGLIHGCPSGPGEAAARRAANMDQFPVFDPNGATVMVRTFINQSGGAGIGRALLSDRYASYDNLDMVMALLAGVKETGLEVEITGCDISERRMVVRMNAPGLTTHAPELLKGYHSPFGHGESGTYGRYGITAREEGKQVGDVVSAGIVATNSETGGGAWNIVPRFEVLQCTNGMTIMKDAMRAVHLGGKLDEGVIKWTEDTEERNVTLIAAKTRDAVTAFLNVEYMDKVIEKLTEKAVKVIEDPAKMVELVAQKMHYTDEQQAGILNHFIKGGQVTCGGIMQAVTSWAQEIEDSDTAFEFETSAIAAMEVAYASA